MAKKEEQANVTNFDFLDNEIEPQNFEDIEFEENEPILKKVGSELLGTSLIVFIISLVSAISYIKFSSSAIIVVALTTAFIYAVCYYIFSRYSGGHFNPAITISSMILKTTTIKDGLFYIISQIVGGVIGAGLAFVTLSSYVSQVFTKGSVFHTFAANGFGDETPDKHFAALAQQTDTYIAFNLVGAIIIELIGIVFITAIYIKITNNFFDNAINAIILGLGYFVGITMSYLATGGSLNPARSIGTALFAEDWSKITEDYPLVQLWFFVIIPILGSVIVSIAYQLINESNLDYELEDSESDEWDETAVDVPKKSKLKKEVKEEE